MKNLWKCVSGVCVVMSLGLTSANAQTVANGPYYAMPAWDQTLACTTLATCPRFIVLSNMGSAAVLDRETGLVWERAPGDTDGDGDADGNDTLSWQGALSHCLNKAVGGRKGWKLPTVQELASLIDSSVAFPGLTLPAGHPFSNGQGSSYWSATTLSSDTSIAWGVNFLLSGNAFFSGKGNRSFVWCVRGGQGVDPQ